MNRIRIHSNNNDDYDCVASPTVKYTIGVGRQNPIEIEKRRRQNISNEKNCSHSYNCIRAESHWGGGGLGGVERKRGHICAMHTIYYFYLLRLVRLCKMITIAGSSRENVKKCVRSICLALSLWHTLPMQSIIINNIWPFFTRFVVSYGVCITRSRCVIETNRFRLWPCQADIVSAVSVGRRDGRNPRFFLSFDVWIMELDPSDKQFARFHKIHMVNGGNWVKN